MAEAKTYYLRSHIGLEKNNTVNDDSRKRKRSVPYRRSPDQRRNATLRMKEDENHQMKNVSNRKASFRYWDSENFENTDRLADLGFYFPGIFKSIFYKNE